MTKISIPLRAAVPTAYMNFPLCEPIPRTVLSVVAVECDTMPVEGLDDRRESTEKLECKRRPFIVVL